MYLMEPMAAHDFTLFTLTTCTQGKSEKVYLVHDYNLVVSGSNKRPNFLVRAVLRTRRKIIATEDSHEWQHW